MNISKYAGGDTLPPQGMWKPSVRDGVKTALFHCPKCSTAGSLVGTHAISEGGKVTPSMVCPNCDFHEWITLDGWAA